MLYLFSSDFPSRVVMAASGSSMLMSMYSVLMSLTCSPRSEEVLDLALIFNFTYIQAYALVYS